MNLRRFRLQWMSFYKGIFHALSQILISDSCLIHFFSCQLSAFFTKSADQNKHASAQNPDETASDFFRLNIVQNETQHPENVFFFQDRFLEKTFAISSYRCLIFLWLFPPFCLMNWSVAPIPTKSHSLWPCIPQVFFWVNCNWDAYNRFKCCTNHVFLKVCTVILSSPIKESGRNLNWSHLCK